MSKKIKAREEALAAREEALKQQFFGSGKRSGRGLIIKYSLVGGVISLLIYMIYKTFFLSPKETSLQIQKSKKTKPKTGNILFETMISMAIPYLGKLMDRLLSSQIKKGKQKEIKN